MKFLVEYKDNGRWTDFWVPNDEEIELRDGRWYDSNGIQLGGDPYTWSFFHRLTKLPPA